MSNKQNLIKNIKSVGKRFLGNLNYGNLKKGLDYNPKENE